MSPMPSQRFSFFLEGGHILVRLEAAMKRPRFIGRFTIGTIKPSSSSTSSLRRQKAFTKRSQNSAPRIAGAARHCQTTKSMWTKKVPIFPRNLPVPTRGRGFLLGPQMFGNVQCLMYLSISSGSSVRRTKFGPKPVFQIINTLHI